MKELDEPWHKGEQICLWEPFLQNHRAVGVLTDSFLNNPLPLPLGAVSEVHQPSFLCTVGVKIKTFTLTMNFAVYKFKT